MAIIAPPPYFETLRQRAYRTHREMLERVAESLDRIAISEELLRKPVYRAAPLKPDCDPQARPDQHL
jgi:hypothetical protein